MIPLKAEGNADDVRFWIRGLGSWIRGSKGRAGVPPAQRARPREQYRSRLRFSYMGRPDACLTLAKQAKSGKGGMKTLGFQVRQIPALLGGKPDSLKDWAASWEPGRVLGYAAVIAVG